jgi:cytochrome oxidase Cu insertion factor (SCO1/SenC/PrrC family)
MLGTILGIGGGALELVLSARWLWQMRRVRIPKDLRPIIAAHLVAVALGVAAFVLGASAPGRVSAAVAIVGGGVFLALQTQSRQARVAPAVAIGGPVIEFTLPDHEGRPFDLATLRGKPFLLKFFRGHW